MKVADCLCALFIAIISFIQSNPFLAPASAPIDDDILLNCLSIFYVARILVSQLVLRTNSAQLSEALGRNIRRNDI